MPNMENMEKSWGMPIANQKPKPQTKRVPNATGLLRRQASLAVDWDCRITTGLFVSEGFCAQLVCPVFSLATYAYEVTVRSE